MSESSYKSIRNATIASTIAGLIVLIVPAFRDYAVKFFSWLWSVLSWVWEALIASYSLPGWTWLILFASSIFGFVVIYLAVRSGSTPAEYKSYIEDTIYDAKWRWNWVGNQITNIWCYCPRCDATLVYNDTSSRFGYLEGNKTTFMCENCNNHNVASIEGGNKNYAIGAVKREIERRVRTNEYKKNY